MFDVLKFENAVVTELAKIIDPQYYILIGLVSAVYGHLLANEGRRGLSVGMRVISMMNLTLGLFGFFTEAA